MMKIAHVVAAGILALTLASTAFAQDGGIYSAIDSPASGASVASTNIRFTGWAFHCEFGQQPQQLTVYYRADDGSWVFAPLANPVTGQRQSRPDVQNVFAPYCPHVGPYVGFDVTLANGVPAGTRTFLFAWGDRTGPKNDYVQVTVRPYTCGWRWTGTTWEYYCE